MSKLPHTARTTDLLRWVYANPNKPFDPPMVVTLSTGHADDWEFRAVAAQMEDLRRQGHIMKLKQDASGSTFWTITDSGVKYLRALEATEQVPEGAARELRATASAAGSTRAKEYIAQVGVFLCHSSADKKMVRQLYKRLKAEGFLPWLDEEDLVAGQDWEYEIKKAVRETDVVLVCLSRNSVSKAGFVQKEIKYALDVADEQPEGSIFIVPLKLEECDVPQRLSRWHWIEYFAPEAHDRLIRALRARSNAAPRRR